MKAHPLRKSLLSLFAVGLLLAATPDARAQAERPDAQVVRVKKLEGLGRRALVRTPIYNSNVPVQSAAAREWGRVRVSYEVGTDWVDELSTHFYVMLAMREDGRPKYTFLETQITYVDVAQGRSRMAEVYVRPQTLLRFGEIVAIGVEVKVDGALQDRASESSIKEVKGAWWENPRLESRAGLLLNRTKTPFAYVNIDSFESILQ